MDIYINRNENLVNYTTTSTSAINQGYEVPTSDPESLFFKIKNNVHISFTFQDLKSPESIEKKEKDELNNK